MNLKNLILTDIKGMNREQWLEFRQPLTHVTNFIKHYYGTQVDYKGMPEGYITKPQAYEFLKHLFATDQWKEFLFPCIGASEIAAIVGLNKYQSNIELYYEKVGLKEAFREDNKFSFWGKRLEDKVAEMWQYWEGDADSLIKNYNQEKIVRKCRKLNAYVQNRNFPWIFCSLDRIINKYSGKEEGSLEAKCMMGWAANMWENGIPPQYVCQLQTQLAVTELKHGEIAVLIDGNTYDLFQFDTHEGIQARMIAESKKFTLMIKAGIEQVLLSRCCPDQQKTLEHLSNVDRFSPEPDGSLAYESYLKQSYRDMGLEITGSEVDLQLAKSYKFFGAMIGALEDKQRECSNKLKTKLKEAAVLDFGDEGKVTWKQNAKGSRVFNVRVTPEAGFVPDRDLIKSEPLEPITELPPGFE